MTTSDNERPSTEDVRVSDEAIRAVSAFLGGIWASEDTALRVANDQLLASGYPQALADAEECQRRAEQARDKWRAEADRSRERAAELEASARKQFEQRAKEAIGFREANDALRAENTRLREELRSEQMERSDAEREADRLREELDVLRETHDETQLARMQLQGERARLREELRLTTAELHAAGDHLVRLDDEVTRLRAECDALRHEVCQRIAERAGETFRKRALHDHYVTLRDGIEKLRDDYTNGWVDVDGYPHSPQPAVARRLTEMLEGDFQEQLDRARVKYRGALDELRDK